MDHRTTIEQYLDTLRKYALQRDEAEYEMGKIHLAVRTMCNLIEDKAEREGYKAMLERYKVHTSLSDLIDLALRMSDKALTPREIRDFIVNCGSEVGTQQNILQSVHTILRRMEQDDKIAAEINEDGTKAFKHLTVGQRILKAAKGIDPANANRVGKRIENRFPQTAIPLSSLLESVAAAERAEDKDKGAPERWKSRWKK